MEPTSAMCRAQEAFQQDRAANDALENVRIVAARAAIAWAQEAVVAERREARHERTRMIAEITTLQKERANDERDRCFSENPDRGLGEL